MLPSPAMVKEGHQKEPDVAGFDAQSGHPGWRGGDEIVAVGNHDPFGKGFCAAGVLQHGHIPLGHIRFWFGAGLVIGHQIAEQVPTLWRRCPRRWDCSSHKPERWAS